MMRRLVIGIVMTTLSIIPQTGLADCTLNVRLNGCVLDAVTRKPMVGARVFYESTDVYTDDRGCFLINYQSTVADGNFFPTHYCVLVYKRGYEVAVSCQRRESLEPFPPCIGTSILNLSFHYGIIEMAELSTDVSDPEAARPDEFALYQNFPNPFNPDTEIGFALGEASHVCLEVFDALGRRVALLHEGYLPAGYHQVNWMTRNAASGVYFYRLRAGDRVETKRMMLLK